MFPGNLKDSNTENIHGLQQSTIIPLISKAGNMSEKDIILARYRPRWLGWEMEESRPDLIGNLEKALLEAVKTQPVLAFIASESREFGSYIGDGVDELCIEGMKTCYFLDCLGPKGFALELSRRTSSKVIGFDHRKSVLSRVSSREDSDNNLTFYVNIESSSSTAAYEYFSAKLSQTGFDKDDRMRLLNHEDHERVESILKYIEDGDLRRWSLPDIKAFNIGLREWRSKLNCITNSCMYQQLGIRADGSSDFTDEIGKELSRMSAEAGLRPIGAVTYMQHNNLKMCLRTIDSSTDTSEIAKAYGGGGSASSSSFIIRMDEYNQWLSMQSSPSRVPYMALLSRGNVMTAN
ncbi:hypothetical protein OROMI_033283 [Orobanche minor]